MDRLPQDETPMSLDDALLRLYYLRQSYRDNGMKQALRHAAALTVAIQALEREMAGEAVTR